VTPFGIRPPGAPTSIRPPGSAQSAHSASGSSLFRRPGRAMPRPDHTTSAGEPAPTGIDQVLGTEPTPETPRRPTS